VSTWLLHNAISTIFQLYHVENKIIVNAMMMMMMMMSALYYTNKLSWILYSASPLKQQSPDRHVTPLGHIILIPSPPVFALSP
jgi:hypothetical protein